MKKETLVTAVVFFGVGFLVGYMYNAHQRADTSGGVPAVTSAASPGGMQGVSAAAGGAGDTLVTPAPDLPPGHPPLNIETAVTTLKKQAAQNPKDPEPPLRLANLFYDQQRFQEAVDWYEKALRLNPRNVNARTDLGTSYFNIGRPQQALEEYRKSLEIEPNHQPTMFNIIVVNLEGIRNVAAARAAWEGLNRLNPNYPGLDRLKRSLDAAGTTSARP